MKTQFVQEAQKILAPSPSGAAAACTPVSLPKQQTKGQSSLQKHPLWQTSAWEQSKPTLFVVARTDYIFNQRPQVQESLSNKYLFNAPNDS